MGLPCRIERVSLSGHEASVRVFSASRDAAPTIIALHGFTGSGLDFMPLREAMNPDSWNWICPDFPGHGISDSPSRKAPYSLENALRLIDLARRFTPASSNAHLLGYSMGGRIALHYLLHINPIPCAVIGSSPGISNPEERAGRMERDEKLVSLLKDEGINAFCEYWERQPILEPQGALPEPLRTELYRRRRKNDPLGLANSLLSLGTGVLPSLWEEIKHFKNLACLYGERDQKFGRIAADMAHLNRDIKIYSVPGSGHAPHLENPGDLAPLVESFFSH